MMIQYTPGKLRLMLTGRILYDAEWVRKDEKRRERNKRKAARRKARRGA